MTTIIRSQARIGKMLAFSVAGEETRTESATRFAAALTARQRPVGIRDPYRDLGAHLPKLKRPSWVRLAARGSEAPSTENPDAVRARQRQERRRRHEADPDVIRLRLEKQVRQSRSEKLWREMRKELDRQTDAAINPYIGKRGGVSR